MSHLNYFLVDIFIKSVVLLMPKMRLVANWYGQAFIPYVFSQDYNVSPLSLLVNTNNYNNLIVSSIIFNSLSSISKQKFNKSSSFSS